MDTQAHTNTKTHTIAKGHTQTCKLACAWHVQAFQLFKNSLLYKAKSCKIVNTFAYSELFSRTVSCWVRQHTLAGVAAAGVLANSEGRTTGTSALLGANT